MKKEELKELMEYNLECARHLLLRDGKLIPVAFLRHGNEFNIIPMSFRDENEKDVQVAALRELVKKKNADVIFMIVESWYVTYENKEDLDIMPSEHPMRKECVFLVGECEDGRVAMTQIFERENDKIIFGEKIDMNESYSTRFDFGLKDKKHGSANPTLN